MHLALEYAFGMQRWVDVQDARFKSLRLVIHCTDGMHVEEWRQSTVSVLVDDIDKAARLTAETGDSLDRASGTYIRVSFCLAKNPRGPF